MESQLMIASFFPSHIIKCNEIDSNIKTALIITSKDEKTNHKIHYEIDNYDGDVDLNSIKKNLGFNPTAISIFHKMLDTKFFERNKSTEIFCWTVNNIEDEICLKADNIITDSPRLVDIQIDSINQNKQVKEIFPEEISFITSKDFFRGEINLQPSNGNDKIACLLYTSDAADES